LMDSGGHSPPELGLRDDRISVAVREEALRTWVGVNYLLRTLGGEWHGTVAVLYVGRAHSAWVAYALDPAEFGNGTRRSRKEHPE